MANEKPVTTRTAAAESKDKEVASRGPVTSNERGPETNEGLSTVEGREEQTKVVDERLEKLNADNRAGHEKNMKRIEEDATRAHEASKDKPTSGREWNRNTPVIDKNGNKHWQ